ncbi:MAG: MFS transporter, partial [Burkholderiaceae bacterium]
GKLPPVLPQVQVELQITLVQAGILVTSFQLAGALVGMIAGALADRFGARNLMVLGLMLLAAGSLLGWYSQNAHVLLVSRAVESIGFVLASLPAPALLRATVAPQNLSRWLGLWGTYMPTGFALALIISPWLADNSGWRAAWLLHAVVAALAIGLLLTFVADPAAVQRKSVKGPALATLFMQTLRSDGPWLCAAVFAFYAGAYLSIVAFLPTIYQQAGLLPAMTGWLTALVAAINITGNISAGQLIHRGISAPYLIIAAAIYLLAGAWVAYAAQLSFLWTYLAILSVSAVMGLIPGSLFYLVNRYAPSPSTVSTSVGLMQQGSAVGQLIMPVVVAALATRSNGWQNTWWVIALCTLVIVCVALKMIQKETGLRRVD